MFVRKEKFVNRLFATNLIMVMLLSPLSTVAFADFANSRKSLVEDKVPKDKRLICGDEGTVFYSQQYKFKLKDGIEADERLNSAHVVVKVKDHKMKRCWKTFNPKKFGRKIVKVYPEVNRFSIEGPQRKAAWWDIKNRIKYWWRPERLYINYALVLTSKEDESALEAQEVKLGWKKKEVAEEEELIRNIEENNQEDQVVQLNVFKKEYIRKVNDGLIAENADPYDPYDIATQGRIDSLKHLSPVDMDLYYNRQEVEEINEKIMENKQKIIRRLSDISGQELITSGKVVELSRNNPEQTYRLVINNNIGPKGSKEAFKLAYVNSKLERPLTLKDGGQLIFDSSRVCDLPGKLQEAIEEEEKDDGVAKMIKDVKTIEDTPTFLNSLYNCLPRFSRSICEFIHDTKEDIKTAREKKDFSRRIFDFYFGRLKENHENYMAELEGIQDAADKEYKKAEEELGFITMKDAMRKICNKYDNEPDVDRAMKMFERATVGGEEVADSEVSKIVEDYKKKRARVNQKLENKKLSIVREMKPKQD